LRENSNRISSFKEQVDGIAGVDQFGSLLLCMCAKIRKTPAAGDTNADRPSEKITMQDSSFDQ